MVKLHKASWKGKELVIEEEEEEAEDLGDDEEMMLTRIHLFLYNYQ